jgi:hypothetical protein
MKLTSVAPSRSSDTRRGSGARTLNTMSDIDQSFSRSATISTPAARYASSPDLRRFAGARLDRDRKPCLMSFAATSGTVATRFSPANRSRGTPISNDIPFSLSDARLSFA